MNSEEWVKYLAEAADDKKAEDIVMLKMRGISIMADYFLICHGNSDKQVQAIATAIKKAAEEKGVTVHRLEGYDQARWVLIDLGDVVAHVFHKDERDYYQLEKLWGDAPVYTLEKKPLV
ncbi:ribosome silencing factor [Sporolactobacillus spathodeae]|uniref:Ribosomal silencing factor RsfS n=1 Tax=Sporolactobacillus spathodeae TaxID=1465502 RepID=A0ABS2Q6E8_9BACL|nr:ribosome silencing factor [Sporolactobacillus spathodeae]MBM7657366.1 ribosome-associated protein [Sporolactobacillus spathodeae]